MLNPDETLSDEQKAKIAARVNELIKEKAPRQHWIYTQPTALEFAVFVIVFVVMVWALW